MNYYENTGVMPIYKNGVKLFVGDTYVEVDGKIDVFRRGSDMAVTQKTVLEKVTEEVVVNVTVMPPKVDEIDIEKLSKVELEAYAKSKFGVDIDKRKSIKTLVKQIKDLMR